MSKTTEIRVPDIGDFDKVPVIEVLVSEGDEVEKDQSLITLESDKATMEIPAPAAGRLVKLSVAEGDEVAEGDVIGTLESDDDAGAPDKDEAQNKSRDQETAASAKEEKAGRGGDAAENTEDDDDTDRKDQREQPVAAAPYTDNDLNPAELPHASPSVRRLARELGVALDSIAGSGRKGRITEDDLTGHIKQAMTGGAGAGLAVAPPPRVDFSRFGEIETEKLSRIKLKSGPALHRNWVSIPHVTQFDEADITEMEAFRKAHVDQAKAAGTRLTPLVFLIKAVVAALNAFPHVNASLSDDGQSLVYKKYFHIGVAVDTDNGLVVPVIRDCDKKGLMALATELGEVSEKARAGKLSAGDMQGGCFSISSLGGIGGTAFTPIVNAPEVAILGVSRARMKPVWDGESFRPRLMLPLSLSYDHRVVDGADAARFTRFLSGQLEDIRRLLL